MLAGSLGETSLRDKTSFAKIAFQAELPELTSHAVPLLVVLMKGSEGVAGVPMVSTVAKGPKHQD